MPYECRRDAPGKLFHVTARVNWRAWHLQDERPKAVLARRIALAAETFEVAVLASVLMSNHFHSVVQSPPPPAYRRLTSRRTACRHLRPWPRKHWKSSVIAQFMYMIRHPTSVRRHKDLELSGRFWEGKYDARPVEDDLSLVVRIAYDHRNPVKAGIVEQPEDYPWSTAGEWATSEPGDIPLRLPDELPFGLERDGLQRRILKYQRSRVLDEVADDLDALFSSRKGYDPEILLEILRRAGPMRAGDAA